MAEKSPLYTKIFEWTIGNFTKEAINNFPTGKIIKSSTFGILVGDEVTTWSLFVNPNGDNEENKNKIEIFLHIHNLEDLKNMSAFQALFNIGIKRNGVRKDFIKTSFKSLPLKQFENGYGFTCFTTHTEFFDPINGFINDGKLTLLCQVVITKPSENDTKTEAPLMNTWLSNYKDFFDDETFTDFEIKTSDGETFAAHKTILAARSPVFYAMLKPETKEAEENSVDIPDFDSEIMEEVLRFVYYNEVENLDKVAAVLIHAADKYQLKDLRKMCVESLLETVTAHNVLAYSAIADLLSDMEQLFGKCIKIIVSYYPQIQQSEMWKNFSKDLKLKILHEAFKLTNVQTISASSLP